MTLIKNTEININILQVEFIVDIVGTPEPDITWYKDGHEVYDTKKYEFKRIGDRYMLVLLRSEAGDAGDIRVKATNKAGVASSQAVLRIEGNLLHSKFKILLMNN